MARTPIFIEVKDSAGNVVPAASINIKRRQNGADATLYNAETAGSVISNPTIADSLGRVSVWVDRGDYNAFVTGTGISAYTVPIDAGPTGDAEIDTAWLPAALQSIVVGGNTVTRQTGGTMPAGAVDGDRCIYTVDATNGVTWEFIYRSASASASKWEFIGGGVFYTAVSGALTTASLFPQVLTSGPSMTIPLTGEYEMIYGLFAQTQAAGLASLQAALYRGAVQQGSVSAGQVYDTAQAIFDGGNQISRIILALTAADVMTMRVGPSGAVNSSFSNGWIHARPVRVT